MKEFFIILIIAAVAVGFMILGLAITRIRKGRDLQTDVGNNDDMRRLGLVCTSKAFAHEDKVLRGETKLDLKDCDDGCSGCSLGH